ncbi:MAG: cytochrome d ubiquinol oxidase subunit II [Chloroflexi bacterium]|nr:cytochrome d ubiquinol oxidase subunit II [Chloroflexota bacterium]
MDLNTVWFILIAVLFIGFFFLEGFDYGVGILLPFLGKNDTERRVIINTIGPFWDGNEVWLITAGGAMFAAFPSWYATMFSGFYLALVLMLVALIVRAVGFEFRSKRDDPRWRYAWDWAIFFGSAVPAVLWGVAIANLMRGLPIGEGGIYQGTFFTLLNPYALAGGAAMLLIFIMHGALFLSLKSGDPIKTRAEQVFDLMWIPGLIVVLGFVGYTYIETDIFTRLGVNPGMAAVTAALALFAAGFLGRSKRYGWAFVAMGVVIAATTIVAFQGMFPRVMISTLGPAYTLTIYNAASSAYTLRIMTIIAVTFVPIVLAYQGWTYYTFGRRVLVDDEEALEY